MNLKECHQWAKKIVFLSLLGVKDLDRKLSTFQVHYGSFIEVKAEMVNIHSGRHDHNLRNGIMLCHSMLKKLKGKLTFNLLFPCSARRFWAVLTTLNNTSVWMVLSWASSRMMTLYLFRSGSSMASLSNIPSVKNLILVLKLEMSSKRTVYPSNCCAKLSTHLLCYPGGKSYGSNSSWL